MPAIPFKGKTPQIGVDVFIAPNAWVIGDVEIGDRVSILFGAVLRGDILPIRIGSETNIQDNAVFHTSRGVIPCTVGERATVGHGAILHGCTVGDDALIGMGATVLDQAEIGNRSGVGAQSLVPMKMKVPENMLAVGVPAKVRREMNEQEREFIEGGVENYLAAGREYRNWFERE